jgi:Ca2+-transporting ATPase
LTTASAIASPPKGIAWQSRPAEEVLAHFVSSATGLSAQEAAQHLAANGPNELIEGKRISPWQIFLGQFKSLIIWILVGAGVISGVLGEVVDASAILAVVVLNAVIGFYQEFKADRSIAALKKMTAPQARVRRDGQVTSIPASGIVTGDILALVAGDLVAADARLLTAASLKCIEATLTGEAEAENKRPATLERDDVPLGDRENMAFMGTSVAAGTGQAVVVATAMNTELGRIAGLIEEAGAEERTPLEKKLESFGRVLVWAALGIVALLFVLGLLRGTKPRVAEASRDSFRLRPQIEHRDSQVAGREAPRLVLFSQGRVSPHSTRTAFGFYSHVMKSRRLIQNGKSDSAKPLLAGRLNPFRP